MAAMATPLMLCNLASPVRRRHISRNHAVVGAACALVLLLHAIAVEAQQPAKIWRIGFISVTAMNIDNVFFQQLRELGYVEGQNLVVERRYSEGRAERFPEFAAALARLSLNIIGVTT